MCLYLARLDTEIMLIILNPSAHNTKPCVAASSCPSDQMLKLTSSDNCGAAPLGQRAAAMSTYSILKYSCWTFLILCLNAKSSLISIDFGDFGWK